MGKCFEEFSIGEEYETPGRTITETDIVQFAGISGDCNPIHTDEEYAKKSFFGRRIAHGLLTLSIMTGLWMRLGIFEGTNIAFYGIDRLRFIKPVFIGDTIRARLKITEKIDKGEKGGLINIENTIINQRDETVMVCQALLLMKKKDV